MMSQTIARTNILLVAIIGLLLALPSLPGAEECTISTVAGGYPMGDGGQATSALLSSPWGMAQDSAGNLYFADSANNRIRKVDTAGVITTVAGHGNPGCGGDGGPAVEAGLLWPSAITFDAAGNLYIADTANHFIRKVDTHGIISTVAGTNPVCGSHSVPSSYANDDGRAAVNAWLSNPMGVAVDANGNIFISDTDNRRVRKVDAAGIITTFAGNGMPNPPQSGVPATSTGVPMPLGLTFDAAGALVIGDGYGAVYRVDGSGMLTIVAGWGTQDPGDGGPAAAARLKAVFDVAVDRNGNVLIADYFANRIRKVDTSGTITTIAGTGIAGFSGDGEFATSALIHGPKGIVTGASGELFFSDGSNNRIRMVDAAGTISTVAGGGIYSDEGVAATESILYYPEAVALDRANNLYISDFHNNRVRKMTPDGTITTVVGNSTAGFSGDGGPATSAQVQNIYSLATDGQGNLYLGGDGRVRKVDAEGIITTVAGGGPSQNWNWWMFGPIAATSAVLGDVRGIAVNTSGDMFISNASTPGLCEVKNGLVSKITGTAGVGSFQLALDGADNLFISSSTVIKRSPSGEAAIVAGGGAGNNYSDGIPALEAQLSRMTALATDPAGNIYLSSEGTRIRKVDTSGIIRTVAGGRYMEGFSGDGGPAGDALIGLAESFALDSAGNLYFADAVNNRVRKISCSYVVSVSTGTGGSVVPDTVQTVASGTTTTFEILPAAGYSVASATGCGGSLDIPTGRYTTGPAFNDCTVSVAFSPIVPPAAPATGIGVFRGNGAWYVDTTGDHSADNTSKFGITGDIPVTGDWNGNGTTKIGVFRPSTSFWYLDMNNNHIWDAGDVSFKYGITGDIPVTGDWNADGTTDVGVFRGAADWYLDLNGSRSWNTGDAKVRFGIAGDIPVTGDWNGDGTTEIGVYRAGDWYIDLNNSRSWNTGDLKFRFGIAGDLPVTGDWNADGITDVGVFRGNGVWYLDMNGSRVWDAGDSTFKFGIAGDKPVAGNW